ncbi:chorismate synthase [[Eubacterium] cellulosolvens]
MVNRFGNQFTFTPFGESHGKCVGALVDGCPAGLELLEKDFQKVLARRVPRIRGLVSSRIEHDKVEILSGLFNGFTTGAPICLLAWNMDIEDSSYEEIRFRPRPGHADYTAWQRYGGFNDHRGGGMFSGRITVAYIMAGVIALKLLRKMGIEVLAHTTQIDGVKTETPLTFDEIKANRYESPVRCAEKKTSEKMIKQILQAKSEEDSVGGVVQGIVLNPPAGIGDPVANSLDADLAKLLYTIPGVKGVEVGSGFHSAEMRGSQSNDPIIIQGDKIVTLTNNAGGIIGGLTTGMPIIINVAFKPTPSIGKEQKTVDLKTMNETQITIKGRHDPCIVPKAVPVVEASLSLVLIDHLLMMGKIPRTLGMKKV